MSDYPTLTEMGVTHPDQIARYSLSSFNYVDYLRVVYRRPKGSFLATSRMYEFPRIHVDVRDAEGSVATRLQRDPVLVAAIDELDRLLAVRGATETVIAELRREIGDLEAELSGRIEVLSRILDRLEAG